MESWVQAAIDWLLATLSLPEIGLSAIFTVSFISATLLPLGSEPAVFAYVQLMPTMFWPAVVIATIGNTLGGLVSYWMGWVAHKGYDRWQERNLDDDEDDDETVPHHSHHSHSTSHSSTENNYLDEDDAPPTTTGRWHETVQHWLDKLGPPALLLSWLPIVGDPLCSVAGWLRLPLLPCVIFMAIGKFARYLLMTIFLLWVFPYFVN